MKKKVLFLARCLIFFLILFFVLGGLNHILEPKYYLKDRNWPATPAFRGFYEMEPDSVDVLVLGSSVAMNNVIPQQLYDDYGIRSYNLCSEQQNVLVSYYWLKEALRYQHPKLVVFEPYYLQDLHPEYPVNSSTRLTMIPLLAMKWSPVKLEAVKDVCRLDPDQKGLDYFFTNNLYHQRWKELTVSDFIFDKSFAPQLFGWAPGKQAPGGIQGRFHRSDEITDYPMRQDMVEYLGRMAALCKENGVRLVMVKFPEPKTETAAIDYAYRQLAKEYELDFYNFGEDVLYDRLGADPATDYVENHGNLSGNQKNSALLGEILSTQYGLSPVRDAQYERSRSDYAHILADEGFRKVTDVDAYLQMLQTKDYVLLFTVKDDITYHLKDSTKQLLYQLGLRTSLESETMGRRAYAAIIEDGRVLEQSSEDEGGSLKISGTFGQMRNRYSITSTGYQPGGGASGYIYINNKNYALNKRGLNIVVFDLVTQTVVDSVCFDIYNGSKCIR